MVSPEARKEVLDLVAAGEISAAEAAELLRGKAKLATDEAPEAAVEAQPLAAPEEEMPKAKETTQDPEAGSGQEGPSWLKVRVSDARTGQSRVRVNIPLRVVRVGMRLGSGFVPRSQRLDWEELTKLVDEGGVGMLVDVQDDSSGEHVEVYVE